VRTLDMEALSPVYTATLFPGLHVELVRLLRGLSESDWSRATVARAWRVRELDGYRPRVH